MNLLIALLLVLVNGVFVAAEFALIASMQSRIEEVAESGRRTGKVALAAMKRLGLMLAGTQLGVTIASLALGSVAEPTIEHLLEGPLHELGLSEAMATFASVVVALLLVVFVHLVLGEMVPKGVALAEPERTLLLLALPVAAFVWLFRPVIVVLNGAAGLGARLMGVEPTDELKSSVTSAEFAVMLEESHGEGLIESEDHELLTAALEFLDRRTDSVMVPRDRVVWVSRLTPVAEVEEAMRVSGHSRILVSRSGLDDVIGFVHAKDLLRLEIAARGRPIPASVIRPVLAVATTSELGGVLLAMRRARRHVAIVRDTQRDTVGMITLEDVLEVIVGAISDETDRTQVVAEEQR